MSRRVVDPKGATWTITRTLAPWRNRCSVSWPRESVWDGDIGSLIVVLYLLLTLVAVGVELLTQALALPGVLVLRLAGVMTTPIRLRNTATGQAWTVTVRGFLRAGRRRAELAVGVRAQGRSALDQVAVHWVDTALHSAT